MREGAELMDALVSVYHHDAFCVIVPLACGSMAVYIQKYHKR